MEEQKKIKDVYCPHCGESLIFSMGQSIKVLNQEKTTICLSKNNRPLDRVLLFKVVRGNEEEGVLELSIEPGNYDKYSSLNLFPEEELILIHPRCRKSMNDKSGFVKMLVKYEGSEEIVEFFIYARYDIEITLYKKNGEVGSYYSGKKFESLAKYLEGELKKISDRE
jgi:hypothetical protein